MVVAVSRGPGYGDRAILKLPEKGRNSQDIPPPRSGCTRSSGPDTQWLSACLVLLHRLPWFDARTYHGLRTMSTLVVLASACPRPAEPPQRNVGTAVIGFWPWRKAGSEGCYSRGCCNAIPLLLGSSEGPCEQHASVTSHGRRTNQGACACNRPAVRSRSSSAVTEQQCGHGTPVQSRSSGAVTEQRCGHRTAVQSQNSGAVTEQRCGHGAAVRSRSSGAVTEQRCGHGAAVRSRSSGAVTEQRCGHGAAVRSRSSGAVTEQRCGHGAAVRSRSSGAVTEQRCGHGAAVRSRSSGAVTEQRCGHGAAVRSRSSGAVTEQRCGHGAAVRSRSSGAVTEQRCGHGAAVRSRSSGAVTEQRCGHGAAVRSRSSGAVTEQRCGHGAAVRSRSSGAVTEQRCGHGAAVWSRNSGVATEQRDAIGPPHSIWKAADATIPGGRPESEHRKLSRALLMAAVKALAPAAPPLITGGTEVTTWITDTARSEADPASGHPTHSRGTYRLQLDKADTGKEQKRAHSGHASTHLQGPPTEGEGLLLTPPGAKDGSIRNIPGFVTLAVANQGSRRPPPASEPALTAEPQPHLERHTSGPMAIGTPELHNSGPPRTAPHSAVCQHPSRVVVTLPDPWEGAGSIGHAQQLVKCHRPRFRIDLEEAPHVCWLRGSLLSDLSRKTLLPTSVLLCAAPVRCSCACAPVRCSCECAPVSCSCELLLCAAPVSVLVCAAPVRCSCGCAPVRCSCGCAPVSCSCELLLCAAPPEKPNLIRCSWVARSVVGSPSTDQQARVLMDTQAGINPLLQPLERSMTQVQTWLLKEQEGPCARAEGRTASC
ncbi:hypothetical protein TREES_T100014267 [Tupaia chinensis]|uniref:Uncharacterized protein n=1 Tax=Tupaia chinensis TaxID=246437 RepID=L9JIF6_TUPCH|nr:hypothetical protein TREES_T100014267 [Tupaia chinensis]